MKSIFTEYARETTVHGLKYVVISHNKYRRGFWAVVLLICVTGLMYTTFDQVADLLSYPSAMSLKVQVKAELPFPAVTICSLNQIRRSQVKTVEGLEQLLLTTSDFVSNSSLEHPADFQFDNITSEGALKIRSMAHTLEDTFDRCFWADREFPCKDFIQAVPLDTNVCFTFNKPSLLHNKSFATHTIGAEFGLRVTLNAMQEEYVLAGSTRSAGFNVILHDFDDTPATRSEGFVVSPGFSSSVRINLISYFGYPYKSYGDEYCIKRMDRKLKYFGMYDKHGCKLECKVDFLLERCGCKGIYDPEGVPANYCTTHMYLTCYRDAEIEFWSNDHISRLCDCPPTCNQRIYSPSLALALFPSDVLQKILSQQDNNRSSDKRRDRSNYLEVRIYYSNFMMETVEQSEVYSFRSVVALFGGQMGCYLGISFLSFVELGEAFFCCIFRPRSKTTVKNGSPKSSSRSKTTL